MSSRGYRFGTTCGRVVFVQTVRCKALRPEMMNRSGPLILACTHLSHTDPFLLSIYIKSRPIDWLARIEFWKFRLGGWFMEWMNAIPVRRFGVSANAVRTAINRLKAGRVVGICPEGGVAQGSRSVMRGGTMKKGVCLISCRSGVPILPCVMLGTDKLNRVPPWIPPLRAKLWIGFGSKLIYPPANITNRRAVRDAMAEELSREYQALFREVKERFGLTEADVP
ncbi:MAG TPA: lysophospholipid acyltransferase family protein [Tepidisphaeraceae bacterium]|jgi:1-acyl-sn-glycerol-3-phosphate acyltransferase|nr:lysophospholipid acyltransferase family protein [Tepidisphaeraceae bacterium]